jgi:hypothetical protein
VSVVDSTLSDNDGCLGGGIYNDDDGTLDIDNSTISDNEACDGGGIFNTDGGVSVDNSTISDNRAYSGDGGGILNYGDSSPSTINITNSILSGNRSDFGFDGYGAGGAIYNEADGDLATVNIDNSVIQNNRAFDGGGIFNYGCACEATLNVINSTLSNNSATDGGGGGVLNDSGVLDISYSTLSGNTATDAGGGIFNVFSDFAVLTNTTLSGNSATYVGGGIYNEDGITSINNSTLYDNSAADGGGIYSEDFFYGFTTVDLNNSIVANNTNGDCVNLFGTYIGDNNRDSDSSCPGGSTLNLSAGSLASLADNGGATQTHALLTGSNAIDNSGGGATSDDQRGAVAVGTRDIGAFEFDGALADVSFTVDFTTIYEDGVTGPSTATVTVTVILANYQGTPIDISFSFSGSASSADYTGTWTFPMTFAANGSQTFDITAFDDALRESSENLILTMTILGPAQDSGTNPQTIRIISDETRGGSSSDSDSDDNVILPSIDIFDPAVSKIGILAPGQVGLVGEQIEWKITVINNGNAIGNNIVLVDNIIPALQVDGVSSNVSSISAVNGQTVTVTIPTLDPGQSVTYSIFTTVLESNLTVDNTVCLSSNSDNEVCADATVDTTLAAVSQLPSTGETPYWRNFLVLTVILIPLLMAMGLTVLTAND